MNMNDYQSKARSFATGGGLTLEYALLGLAEETGELLGKFAKHVRKTNILVDDAAIPATLWYDAVCELGDVLWFVANVAGKLGVSLDEVAKKNIDKLVERRNAGVICGSGDTTAERIANAQKEEAK